jgi:hypothetical protein
LVKLVNHAGCRRRGNDRHCQPLRGEDEPIQVGRPRRCRRGDYHRQAGKPKAKLVPYRTGKKRRFGQNLLGIAYIADDFDAPLPPELQKYFE